ncbi:MAG: PadR family transcriptional regulator [Actinobacteria bacterium]|nr:PadR family transcriptional regulator [Actinomycetota bacterium]
MNGPSVSRLMALGLLAERGPMHGHRIRREAEDKNVESWGGVSVGALYRELHHMARDGLIEEVRSEQVGGRPERTIYAVTEDGRRELEILRERAMADFQRRPDTLGVALLFGGSAPAEELPGQLWSRRQAIDNLLKSLRSKRARLIQARCLNDRALAVFRRSELFLEAELSWHDEFGPILLKDDTIPQDARTLAGKSPMESQR